MIDEEAAFRAAIVANPDDITARLVYADWLDERGRGFYAATLRQQTTVPYSKFRYFTTAEAEHRRWSRHLRELLGQDIPKSVKPVLVLAEHGQSMAESIRHTGVGNDSLGIAIRHGCIEGVSIEPRHLKYLPALVRKHPIRCVYIKNGLNALWGHRRFGGNSSAFSIRINLVKPILAAVAKLLIDEGATEYENGQHVCAFHFVNVTAAAEAVNKHIIAWAKSADTVHYNSETRQWISSS